MEHKIGEIFEYNGEWYQCLESNYCSCDYCSCNYCDFGELGDCDNIACGSGERNDNKEVHFKKLEKVGKPFYSKFFGKFYQMYKTYIPAVGSNFKIRVTPVEYVGRNEIFIEIKQNKEDMEEKKLNLKTFDIQKAKEDMEDLDKIKVRDYTKVEELNVMEEKKLNLKPFDIQKARDGKPVCTRDGRKARIICFDVKAKKPIAALITNDDIEEVHFYYDDGRSDQYQEYRYDLMMLPEKKEGWINIVKTEDGGYCCKGEVHSDYNDAINENINVLDNRGITVKIEWEE